MSPKPKTTYECTNCGAQFPGWLGRGSELELGDHGRLRSVKWYLK